MDSIMIQSMSNCAICGIQLNSFHEPLITACLHSICRSHTCVQGEDGTTSTTMPSSINKDGASDCIKNKISKVPKLTCSYCDGRIDQSGLNPNIILLEHLSKFGQPLDTLDTLDTSAPETAGVTRGTSCDEEGKSTGKSSESIKQIAGSEGIKSGKSSEGIKEVSSSQCDVKAMCSSCQSSDYVVSFCPKCTGLLCSGCATRHHKLKPFRSHSLLGSNSNQAKAFDLLLLLPRQGIKDQSTNSTHESITRVQGNSIRRSVQSIIMNQSRSDQHNNDHGHNPTAMKPSIIPFRSSMIPSRPSMTPIIERQFNHTARKSRSSSLVTSSPYSLADTIINNSATDGLPVQTVDHQLPVQTTVHGQYQKMVAGESYPAGGQTVPIRKVPNPSSAQLINQSLINRSLINQTNQLISQSLINPANQLINPSDNPIPSKERSSHEEDELKKEQRNLLSSINYFIRLTNEKLIADKNMLIIKQKQCMNRSEDLKNKLKEIEIEEKLKIKSTIDTFFESKNEIMNEYFTSIRSTCNERIQGQESLLQKLNHIKGMIEGIKTSSINQPLINQQLINQPLINQSSPIRPTMIPPGGNGFLTKASNGNPTREIGINQCINPVLEQEVIEVDRIKSLNGILSSTLEKLYKEYKKLSTIDNTHSDLLVNVDLKKFIAPNDLLNELDSVLRSKEESMSNGDDSFSNGSKSGSESLDKDASGAQSGIDDSGHESSNSCGLTNKSHGTSDDGHKSSNGSPSNGWQSNKQQSGQALTRIPLETVTNGSGTCSNSVSEPSGVSSSLNGHLSIDLYKPSSNSSNGKVSNGQIEKVSNRKVNDNGNDNVKIIHDMNPLTPSVVIDNNGKQMNIKINLLPQKRSITSSSSSASGQRTQEQNNYKTEGKKKEKEKEKEKEEEKETGSNKVSGEETKEKRNGTEEEKSVDERSVDERSADERSADEGRKNGSTEKKRENVETKREYLEKKSEERNVKKEESEDEQIILYRKKKKKGKKIDHLQEKLIKKMKKLPEVTSPTSIKSSSSVLSQSKNVSNHGTNGKNFLSKFNGSMPGQICSPQHEKVTKRVRSEESLHSEVSNSNVSNSRESNSNVSKLNVSKLNVSKLRTEMDPRSSTLPLFSPRRPQVHYIWTEREVKSKDAIACPMHGTKLENRIPMNGVKLENFDTTTGTVVGKKLHTVPMEDKSYQCSLKVKRKSRKRMIGMPPLTLIEKELNRTPRMAAVKAIERITVQQRECMFIEESSPVTVIDPMTVINPVTDVSSTVNSPKTIPPKTIPPNSDSATRMVRPVSEVIHKSSSIDEDCQRSFEVLSPPVSSKSNMSPSRELLLFPSNSSHATCSSSCLKIPPTSGQTSTSGQMTATSTLVKRRLSKDDVIESLSVLLLPSADRKNSDQIFDTDQETEVEEEEEGHFFGSDPLPQDGTHGKNDIGIEREGEIQREVSSSSIQLNQSLDMETEEEDESDDQICPICHQEDPPILNSNEFAIANEPVSWTACEICTLWYHDNCVPELRFKSFQGPFYKFICSSCQG